jgi:hypothetical protein
MPGAELAYIDESYDDAVFAMSALIVPTHAWRDAFGRFQAYRKHLKATYGIFTSKELHATDFVAGRGRIAPKPVPKGLRVHLFQQTIQVIASLPGTAIITGAWPRAGLSLSDIHAKAFARIQERLQRRCLSQDSQILVIADEGKEHELTRLARRTKIWNPVGSMFGAWEDGSSYKNIPNDRLIEDPIFKRSHQSYFLQAADFVAFALLKSEVPPTPRVAKYKLDNVFDDLAPVCAKEASRKDPRGLGIVRT